MIKVLTAYTNEIDDAAAAVREILTQLSAEKELLENSVGILTCSLDFVEAGVVKALRAALPFDVAGVTTVGSAVPESGGSFTTLSLLVLTSGDVSFSAALSEPLGEATRDSIGAVYRAALAGLPAPRECALALLFAPYMQNVLGKDIVNALDEASSSVPLFGSLSCDFTMGAHNPLVLFAGESYTDRLALILLSGDVRPRFAAVSIPENKIMEGTAVVTDSEKNVLKTVNDIPAIDYMETVGLARNGKLRGAFSIPVIVDCRDGSDPTAVAALKELPGGCVLLSSSAPVNSTLGFGSIDRDDVLKSVAEITKIAEEGRTDVFLLFSCAQRSFALDLDSMAEIERVKELLGDSAPYLFMYSGGEICSLRGRTGRTANRFLNISAVGCAF